MLRAFFASSQLDQPCVPWLHPRPDTGPIHWRSHFSQRTANQVATSQAITPVMPQQDWHDVVDHLTQQALADNDYPKLLQAIATQVTQILDVPSCRIWQARSHTAHFVCCTAVGINKPVEPIQLEHATWLHETNLTELTVSLTPQTTQANASDTSEPGVLSIVLPLKQQQHILGILEIQLPDDRQHHVLQYAFVQSIARLITNLLQRQKSSQLSQLSTQVLEQVARNQPLESTLLYLCEAVETLLPSSQCKISHLDEGAENVVLSTPSAAANEAYPITDLPAFYAEVLAKHQPLIWDRQTSLGTADRAIADHFASQDIRALWVIPFGNEGAPPYGFLEIQHPTHHPNYAEKQSQLSAITQLASIATENHRNAHRLEKQAMYDGLTGLPNRIFFMQQLSEKLQAQADSFALLFLDVDHFKLVNDSLGHNAGDELLAEITRRLIPCIRRTDIFARLGGDEFAIILNGVVNISQAESIAEQIKAVLSLPFKILDREVFASVSIGIAHSDNYYASPAEILRDADIAMYRAKSLGRSRAATFDKTMHANVLDRMQVEMELRRIVDQLFLDGTSQLQLYYQPIVSLATGQVAGFEALLRWFHPERGMISPMEFIPIAEELGLIIPIGQWVIQEACQQLHRWQTELNIPDLTMSINVSSRQFLQADFLPMVQQILEYTQISPACLKLEITESVLMETANTVIERLEYLRNLGVRLSLDDFGTGYSSLSYLQQFPINTLKVDRSFVNTLAEDQDQVVQAIVALTDGLAMDAVAEGIETPEQLAHLRSLGCEYGQGYFFSPPMNRENAEKMLVQNPYWPDDRLNPPSCDDIADD